MVPEKVGFSTGSDRFNQIDKSKIVKDKNKAKSMSTPGPGHYNSNEVQCLQAMVQKKSRDKIGAFGSTVKRFVAKDEMG